MELRGYQRRLMSAVHDKFRSGFRRVIASAPTGAGKTVLASAWCGSAVRQGKRVLILADRRLLVSQAFRTLGRSDVPVGQIMAGESYDHECPVQVASVATLKSRVRQANEYHQDIWKYLPQADLIIVDECHKGGFEPILEYYQNRLVIGLTATPADAKGNALWGREKYYETFVESVTNSQLIRDGWLLPTRVWAPSEPDIEGVRIDYSSGEYNQSDLSKAVATCTTFADLWKEWEPHQDRKTIIFAPSVAFCHGIRDDFAKKLGEDVVYVIDASTPQQERDTILSEMNGKGRVLVSVDVLREGFDLPIASCAIDLQTNRQLRTYWQKIGRIKRQYPGQTECVWIDMAGNFWRHCDPNGDPAWSELSDAVTTADVKQKNDDDEREPKQVRCPKCKHVFAQILTPGTICPQCGWQFDPRVRGKTIRSLGGKLTEVTVADKVKKSNDRMAEDKWVGELFAGWHAGKSLAQCVAAYTRKHGERPGEGWFAVPGGQYDGYQKVRTRFQDKKDIYREYLKGKEASSCH